MTLTDTAIKNAQTRPSKPCKLHDDNGMYVLIHPNGGKYFRLDYRHEGKRKTLVLGTYPKTTLKQKRQNSDEAKKANRRRHRPKQHPLTGEGRKKSGY